MATVTSSDPRHFGGMSVIEHAFRLPLDHDDPAAGEIEVYAREVAAAGRRRSELPYLLFLQGGPGFASPRPVRLSGWIERATVDYRVLLLDQRGTGRSTPLDFQSLAGKPPREVAELLTCFRADRIVRDCEEIRRSLLGPDGTWTVLGQSFGGFCAVHYLSTAPGSLDGCLIAGGLPPLEAHCDEVYRRTFALAAERNRRYYQRYPNDVARVRAIVAHLEQNDVRLPASGRLSPRRFQTLGLRLGMSDGFEVVHELVRDAFTANGELAYPFLRELENACGFDMNPLYAVLHEACYAQGFATSWSAERVRGELPAFDTQGYPAGDGPVFFTGEMIFPFLFDEVDTLKPLHAAAHLLAEKDDWPRLYDPQRLATNNVPCAAVVYADDMYVERRFSEETARAIRGLRVWLTNEHEHDGLRQSGERVLGRLLDMLQGRSG